MSADDHRLIRDFLLRGNKLAFEMLMRRYEDRLFNTVYHMVGNKQDAEDIVQETFLNAYQSLHNFKQESQFYTWLYRIAVNTMISHKRKKKGTLSIDVGRNGEAPIEPLDGSEGNQPGHAMERREEATRIHKALARMSTEHREVLVLKDMENMKYEAIAEILGVPIGTIRSRLHRARLELREILEKDGKN